MVKSREDTATGYDLNTVMAYPDNGVRRSSLDSYDTESELVVDVLPLEANKSMDKPVTSKTTSNPDHITVAHPTTYMETLIHLLKGNIGPGMFSMGDAFKNCGLVLAPVLTLFLGVVCVHSQHLLLQASRKLKQRTGSAFLPTFSETIDLAFKTGPSNFIKFAKTFGILVNIFLCVTQLGFCCVYFVFISENTKQVMDYYGYVYDLRVHMAVILIPITVSCWIRDLKYLVPVSLVANVCMLVGIVGTLYVVCQDLPAFTDRPFVAHYTKIPLFFGTVIYSFEGIGLVLPLQAQMKKTEKFVTPYGVLNVGMAILTFLLILVGTLGYLKYGEDVLGSLTLNLPPDEIFSQCVRIIISLGVIFTYAIQMYVPVIIMWPAINTRCGFKHATVLEIVFRSLLVLLTFILAAVIPQLSLVISLVGAVSSTALALLFPAVLDIVMRWENITKVDLAKNWAIFVLGIFGFLTGTYASIAALIEAFAAG